MLIMITYDSNHTCDLLTTEALISPIYTYTITLQLYEGFTCLYLGPLQSTTLPLFCC